jgi:hypothetical protein
MELLSLKQLASQKVSFRVFVKSAFILQYFIIVLFYIYFYN